MSDRPLFSAVSPSRTWLPLAVALVVMPGASDVLASLLEIAGNCWAVASGTDHGWEQAGRVIDSWPIVVGCRLAACVFAGYVAGCLAQPSRRMLVLFALLALAGAFIAELPRAGGAWAYALSSAGPPVAIWAGARLAWSHRG